MHSFYLDNSRTNLWETSMFRVVSLFAILIATPVIGVAETMEDLVKRDGRYYSVRGTELFTGVVSGPDRGSFKEGLRHGEWTSFYENGQVKNRGRYLAGQKEGMWSGYYRSGQLFYRGAYKANQKDGPWVSYYEDDTLFYRGAYLLGKETGEWTAFNPDGSVWDYKTGVFEAGVKVGD